MPGHRRVYELAAAAAQELAHTMAKAGTWLALTFALALCAGRSDAWFWNWVAPSTTEPPTTPPTPSGEGSGEVPAGSGEEPDATIASVGARIIDVASGIRKVVQTWDQNQDRGARRMTTVKPAAVTVRPGVIAGGARLGNAASGGLGLESGPANGVKAGEEGGSGPLGGETREGTRIPAGVSGLGGAIARVQAGKQLAELDFSQDGLGMSNRTAGGQDASPERDGLHRKPFQSVSLSKPQGTAQGGSGSSNCSSSQNASNCGSARYPKQYLVSGRLLTSPVARPAAGSPRCLPLESDLPFCSGMGQESFAVPNFLNQSSVGEVRAALGEWARLLGSGCHPSLRRFHCLLLAPPCPAPGSPPAPLPQRSLCEGLRDSCWNLLSHGRLLVPCHALPDPERRAHPCQSVSNCRGNGRLKCIPIPECILNRHACLFVVPLITAGHL